MTDLAAKIAECERLLAAELPPPFELHGVRELLDALREVAKLRGRVAELEAYLQEFAACRSEDWYRIDLMLLKARELLAAAQRQE